MKKNFLFTSIILLILFSGCQNYSVYNGGTSGQIVDAESTSTPKAGIPSVDVYAYTDLAARNLDYMLWQEGTNFTPSSIYYGHTTTDVNGNFSISNIVWKESNPDFGKDADFTMIYLLYYHENFGLQMDHTVIISGSTNNSVYAELTAIRKTTALNLSIYDVSNSSLSSDNVLVSVTVPQSTETITAKDKVYEQTITGSGTIYISYPRWKNAEDKENNIENAPNISIKYSQSADTITWKACAHADNEANDYAFLPDDFSISKVIRNSAYDISLYGKPTVLRFPVINGRLGDGTTAANDGKVIKMMAKDSAGNFTIDCGETTTAAQTIGTSQVQSHGNFTLGSNSYWRNTTYTGRYSTIEVKFFVDGTDSGITKTLRTDTPSYNVILN